MKERRLILSRLRDDGDSTIGVLTDLGGSFLSFTLEDEKRDVKVKGETRIDAGLYEIKFREVLSGLTQTYRKKFSWFTWHLELQGVLNFLYVYIHIGNDDDDTDACILVGDGCKAMGKQSISYSTKNFERLYKLISGWLDQGDRVFIEIRDEPLCV